MILCIYYLAFSTMTSHVSNDYTKHFCLKFVAGFFVISNACHHVSIISLSFMIITIVCIS